MIRVMPGVVFIRASLGSYKEDISRDSRKEKHENIEARHCSSWRYDMISHRGYFQGEAK